MVDVQKLANDYIETWNEADQDRRRAALTAGWTERATYIDPLMRGTGLAQIDGLIGAVHARFPGFRFALLGNADGHDTFVRFSWGLGPDGGDAIVKGTDFVVCDGDRIASVTGFLDQVPNA